MIVRLWRGKSTLDNAHLYLTHVTRAVFPRLQTLAGFLGGRVLRREAGGEVEFLVATEWASWEAIRSFAGDNYDVAVVEPEARAALTAFDDTVEHFEVVASSVGR